MSEQATEQTHEFPASLALALLGAAVLGSLAIYQLVFVSTFNLFDLYQKPDYDLLAQMRKDPSANIRILIGFIALAGFYYLGWWLCQRLRGPRVWLLVLGGAALAALVLLSMYPFDAADIFDNIGHGRILGIYQANPFLKVMAEYRSDPFYNYVAWRTQTSAYGPLWELMAGLTARLAGNSVTGNILAFKLLPGLFWAAGTAVVALLLHRYAPERTLAGTWLMAWNPLVLFETFGNGHNDIAMAFWIVTTVWALAGRRYTLAILALVAGTLYKYIPALLIPAAGWIALRSLPDHRSRLRFIFITGAAAVILIVLAYAPFWHGLATLSITRRTQMITTSLPSILYYNWVLPKLGDPAASTWTSRIAAGLTGLFALWQAWRAGREHSWLSFTHSALYILTFYLLLTCLWFQEWYPVWLVGLAALLPAGLAQGLGLWISFTGLAKGFIFSPIVFLKSPLDPKRILELHLSAGSMSLSWLGAGWVLWKTIRSKRGEVKSQETKAA